MWMATDGDVSAMGVIPARPDLERLWKGCEARLEVGCAERVARRGCGWIFWIIFYVFC